MSYCETCGHDELDDEYDEYDEPNLAEFSDEDIESEYFTRFSDHHILAQEILVDMNMGRDTSVKIRQLLQDMTGKLVLI